MTSTPTEPVVNPRGRSRLGIFLSLLWGAGLLLVIVGIIGIVMLNAPRPLQPVVVDRAQLAQADPGLRWLEAREPVLPLTDLTAPAPLEFHPAPAPQVLGELEAIWDRVRAAERATATANPLPLSASPANDVLASQVQGLASAYWQTTRVRADLGHDLYLATVDDWFPHYFRGQNYQAMATRTRDRSYRALRPGEITSPYRNSINEVAWMYDLQSTYDETRWLATEAAFEAVTKTELEAFDAVWQEELDARLSELTKTVVQHDLAGVRVPTTLLRTLPSPVPSPIDAEFAQMAIRLQAEANAGTPLGMPLSEQEQMRAAFEERYREILKVRIDQALTGQGWTESPTATQDVTEALDELLYPQAAESALASEGKP